MAALLQEYYDELQDNLKQLEVAMNDVRNTCNRDAPGYVAPPPSGPTSRVGRIKNCDQLLSRARELVSLIEVESNDAIPAQRQQWKDRASDHKKRLLNVEKDLSRLKACTSKADREDLLRSSNTTGNHSSHKEDDGIDDETKKQRVEMSNNTERLRGGTQILQNAERVLADTERLGEETSAELVKQRQTILNIQNTTRDTDAEVSEARRIANQMHKVMVQNKAALLGIIVVLSLLILGVIYAKTTSHQSSGSSTTTTIVLPPPAVTNAGGSSDGGLPN